MPTASCRASARRTSICCRRSARSTVAIADWPVQYDELEPHYAIAEQLIGTAGDAGKNPFEAWRSGPYPMPPGPDMFGAILTSEAA